MRNTKIALAVLALVASTAAMAEGVTIYGTIDASIARNETGTAFAGAGNSAGSIFGFKGSEDLGSGMKAGFNLESGINAGTGSTGANGGVGTATFNRQANVFVGSETATVTLGTQISPFITGMLTGVTGVGGNGAFVPGLARVDGGSLAGYSATHASLGAVAATGAGNTGGFFIGNAANLSVNAGGVGVNVLYRVAGAATNTVAPASDKGSDYTAANVTGAIGGINLALAYQNIKNVANADTAGFITGYSDRSNMAFAANTSLGDIRLNGVYSNNKIDDVSHTGYLIGASMPLAGALSGGLTYAKSGLAALGSQTTASVQYNMSKATFAYANYSIFGVASGGGGASANDNGGLAAAKNLLTVGVAHSF
jgi:predicted porin